MSEVLSLLDQLRAMLENATSLQGRLVATAVVAAIAVLAGRFLTPYLTERARRFVDERLVTAEFEAYLQRADEYVPVDPTLVHVVRSIQLAVALLTGLALLLVWGLTGVARSSLAVLGDSVPWILQGGLTVLLVVAAYVATGFLEEFIDRLTRETARFDEHQGEIVIRVAQVAVIAVAGVVALGVWGVELGGLLVGAGFLGIVVGMAARQTLGSMLAGFVLMFSRPFEVGDWISIEGHEGVVTDITIVNTRLENFDGEYVVIPNDSISNSTIINRTRKGRLRVRLDVGIDYSVDPEHAEEVAMDAMSEVEEVMAVPRPQVVPKAFGDSAIVLELRFWIDNPSSRRRWRAKAAVVRAVYTAFEAEGIKIPYPQRELSGRAEAGGFRLANDESEPDLEQGVETPTED